jgi:hypothetical protein
MAIAGRPTRFWSQKYSLLKILTVASVLPGLLLAPLAAVAAPMVSAGAAAAPRSVAAAVAPFVTPAGIDPTTGTENTVNNSLATPTPVSVAARRPVSVVPTTADQGEATPTGRRSTLSFRDLGALYPLELHGLDSQNGVSFSVRANQVVTGAKLHLRYSYSPSLISNLSHLVIFVNGEVAAAVPLPKEQAGMPLSRDIPIEPRLITEFNHLSIQFVGHYTMQCEDPANSALWANVSNASTLEMTVSQLPIANDLGALPLPFFDRRDVRRLQLPFVFGAQPDGNSLESAGIVASWFGALAGYRGALFPTLIGSLPASGNAVVFASGNERPAGLELPPINGPTIAMMDQPNDPSAKLLLVLGRDAAELKTAAMALGLGGATLSGKSATIAQLKDVRPREPYDAPHWISSERPVRFGELAEQRALEVSGYNPDLVRVNLNMPPDLFTWRTRGVPIDLLWRYTPRPTSDKSTLNISVNNNFVRSLRVPVFASDRFGETVSKLLPDGTALAENHITIPPLLLTTQAQLQLHYYYDYVKNGACKDVLVDNVRGAIDPNSTIDLSSFPHYMAMPDLASFANSGFPFTRMADLSQSAVIMPDTASTDDISMYLALMGQMGESTGYPAIGVKVGHAAQVQQFADKDLLVLGASGNQPLLQQWARSMPYQATGESRTFDMSDLVFRLVDWWRGAHGAIRAPRSVDLSLSGDATDAIIMGFQSPLDKDRSVVALVANKPQDNADLLSAIMNADLVKTVQGGLVAVRGDQVKSLASGDVYYVGHLPWYVYVRWIMSEHPILLFLGALLAAMILAVLAFRGLRAIAAKRLKK